MTSGASPSLLSLDGSCDGEWIYVNHDRFRGFIAVNKLLVCHSRKL